MASLKPLQQIHQLQFLSFTNCKYSSTLNPFKFPNKNISTHASHLETTLSNSDTNQVLSRNTNLEKRVVLKDRYAKDKFNFKTKRNNGSGNISNNKDKDKRPFIGKGSRRTKVEGPGNTLRIGLDSCSKMGDVISAIKLYDLAMKEGVKMGQHHYAVLLYLCSSAATGFVQPAKSGSGGRSLNSVANNSENLIESDKKLSVNGLVKHYPKNLDGLGRLMKKSADNLKRNEAGDLQGCNEIQVSEEVKKFALQKGLEIYEKMRLESVVMNEATFTSVARMAMSINDGDMAFNIVKQMQELGINPKLRSYGPALTVYCSNNEVEKAFLVEQDMLKNGVFPEEPELEALLRVSVESGRSEKVYYLLHKLRISVRQVSEGTANVIEKWFMSKAGLRIGKRKWDEDLIVKASENNGGGWHGLGWLGKGKWNVSRSLIGSDGLCKCCGDKLVTIDLDPVETENFAKSVASLANQREKNSSFQKFQKWLDYYGPFDAVVDGANVGLYSQRGFKPTKVNAVVNGIRQMLPSKKWPLIILHNRRIIGDKMDEPVNKTLVEKWKTADALYLTPTGSNDDWYWLYAAIKFKCLLVTNDEMRDHLFQLLGTDFFPKWKERHQVHFSFSEIGPVFRMPPPCSVVIQESEKGHWHVPIKSESESEEERAWLCVNRAPHVSFDNKTEANMTREKRMEHSKSDSHMKTKTKMKTKTQAKLTPRKRSEKKETKKEAKNEAHEMYRNLKSILSPSHSTILSEIESAEKLSGCLIDFQI